MIYEKNYNLTDDERCTLLFLTGNLRVFSYKDVSKPEMNNIYTFFGINQKYTKILKVIIKRDTVILKLLMRQRRPTK